MLQAKCIQKFRDKKDKIIGYKLQDINGQIQDVTSEDLKRAIRNKQINIINLTLTSDDRLIDKKTEAQIQNKILMTDKVEKPQDTNDKLFELAERCANKISNALIGKNVASVISCDKYTPRYISVKFELSEPIIYKGTKRHLDISVDLDNEDNNSIRIGLIDTEKFNTEANKRLTIKNKLDIKEIEIFVDKYVKYIKNLSTTKYKMMFKSLMWLEVLDENIEELTKKYDSNVKVITVHNNISTEDVLKNNEDYLCPYMYTDYTPHIVSDLEKHFIIAFVKDGYSESTLFYSTNKKSCLDNFGEHFRINNNRCTECTYSEHAIGMISDEYVGFTDDKQPIQKVEAIAQKRKDTIIIKVNKLNSIGENDNIEYSDGDSEAAIESIFGS